MGIYRKKSSGKVHLYGYLEGDELYIGPEDEPEKWDRKIARKTLDNIDEKFLDSLGKYIEDTSLLSRALNEEERKKYLELRFANIRSRLRISEHEDFLKPVYLKVSTVKGQRQLSMHGLRNIFIGNLDTREFDENNVKRVLEFINSRILYTTKIEDELLSYLPEVIKLASAPVVEFPYAFRFLQLNPSINHGDISKEKDFDRIVMRINRAARLITSLEGTAYADKLATIRESIANANPDALNIFDNAISSLVRETLNKWERRLADLPARNNDRKANG